MGAIGRILQEALQGGPDEEQVVVETCMMETTAHEGQHNAAIQVSRVGPYRYIDYDETNGKASSTAA